MAAATIGVFEDLIFQFDDLGANDDAVGEGSHFPEEQSNYILRHSQSDPMLTSPSTRDLMRSQQMAIARRLMSLQSCGQQRFLPNQNSHSVEEEFAQHDNENSDDDDQTTEDDISIAPTIEQIKDDYNSCFSCGVSWSENHVSLDCKECGGYALTRPCLACEGQCSQMWTRNLAASHDHRQAQWEGRCILKRSHDKRPKSLMTKEKNVL